MSTSYSLKLDLSNQGYAVIKIKLNDINIGNIRFEILSGDDDHVLMDLNKIATMIERGESFTRTNGREYDCMCQVEYDNRKGVLYFSVIDREEFPIVETYLIVNKDTRSEICSHLREIYDELKNSDVWA
jgi:hypothetical protein